MTRADGILVLYHHPVRTNAPTIMEHVEAFARHSRFNVWNVNTEFGFPRALAGLSFPVVVLHYTLWGTAGYHLDERFLEWLDAGRGGCKIAFFQDEHHYCRQRFAFIERHAVDVIYTLLEPGPAAQVYGTRTKVPRIVTTIPGFVSDRLVEVARTFRLPREKRPIDVGYRGRELLAYMGRGGQEKAEIGRRFLERARGLGLRMDIETGETKRLYGDDWSRFLGSCRAFLGVEAGVSVFDVDDTVRTAAERLLAANPALTFEEIEEALLRPHEGNIHYRTISPRHFEAAAFRTVQVLYEGRYSGILAPGRHYIPLKKDFSNFDDVIAALADDGVAGRIADDAERELVLSGAYGYAKFMEGFDAEVAPLLAGGRDDGARRRVEARLEEGSAARYLRGLARELRRTPFPGRRALSRWVKSALGRT